jgi:hypothetical protein
MLILTNCILFVNMFVMASVDKAQCQTTQYDPFKLSLIYAKVFVYLLKVINNQ